MKITIPQRAGPGAHPASPALWRGSGAHRKNEHFLTGKTPPCGRGASHFSTLRLLASLQRRNSRFALKQPSLRALRCAAVVAAVAGGFLSLPAPAFAMHISEGLLPASWALIWFAVAIPFVAWGLRNLRRRSGELPYFKPLVGLVGAAVFLISCMPIPVPTAGTCSHPSGTGLAAILIGPGLTVVVASIALTLQALFLAHGGLTTLGANIVSMGVAGAYVGYGAYWIIRRLGLPWVMAAFLAGLLSDWATYAMTSVELAAALHGGESFSAMLSLILLAFVPTQLPLGIFEGILCVGALKFVRSRKPELLGIAAAGGAA